MEEDKKRSSDVDFTSKLTEFDYMKNKISKSEIMSEVKQQAANEAMTHFIRHGWAPSFQNLVNYLLILENVAFQRQIIISQEK